MMSEQDDAQLERLVAIGMDGLEARQRRDEAGVTRAKSTFEAAWRNASPAARQRFADLEETLTRSRARRDLR